jgi:TonB family protein
LDHLSAERARDGIVTQEQRAHAARHSVSFASVLVAVLVAHGAILAFLNVFEIAPLRPDIAREIPVDLVSAADAEKAETPQSKAAGQDQNSKENSGKENSDKDQNKSAEIPPKPEAQKPEPPKQEAPKQEAAKPEPPKAEAPKPELPKQEPPKAEPPKQEQAKPEPPKSEPPKSEPPKQEAAKPEPPKQDPPKQELPKQEPAKQDARKSAAQKKEAPKPAPKNLANLEATRRAVENAEAAKASPPAAADRVQAQLPPGRGSQPAKEPLAPPDPNAHGNLPVPFDPVPDIFKAIAVPQSSDTGEDLVSYSTLVFSRLELSKKYPEASLARGTEGSAGIGFTLDDAGNVLDVELLVSSGDADLDEESVALVRRAAPFPAPPQGAKHRFDAVVTFSHR